MAMLAMVPFKAHVYLAGFAMLMGHAEVNYYKRNANIRYKVGRISSLTPKINLRSTHTFFIPEETTNVTTAAANTGMS